MVYWKILGHEKRKTSSLTWSDVELTQSVCPLIDHGQKPVMKMITEVTLLYSGQHTVLDKSSGDKHFPPLCTCDVQIKCRETLSKTRRRILHIFWNIPPNNAHKMGVWTRGLWTRGHSEAVYLCQWVIMGC